MNTPNTIPAEEEVVIFDCRPSFLYCFRWWMFFLALCALFAIIFFFSSLGTAAFLIFGIGLAITVLIGGISSFLSAFSVDYQLTSQRLFITNGIFNKSTEEIELFRIKDITLRRNFMERIFRVGTIEVLSTDDSAPRICILHIPNSFDCKEQLRDAVINARRAANLRPAEFIQS